MAVAVLLVLAADSGSPHQIVLMVGAGAAFSLGLLDDFRSLAPSSKLVGQVLIGAILILGGVRIEVVEFAPLSFVLTVFWVVAMMNALNLMDNMDGLAAGIAAIAAIVLGTTAPSGSDSPQVIAGATAGVALGFLVHNFPPARVFMGDAGSLLLGYLLASAGLLRTESGAANVGLAVLGPLAVLALPIFDTAFVTAARRLAGRPIGRGGRDHTSHRLAALGLSDRGVVVFLYIVAVALASVGALAQAAASYGLPLFVLTGVGLVLFGVFLYEVDVYGRKPVVDKAAEASTSAAVQSLKVYARFGVEIGLDVVLLTVAYYVSYVIRFEGLPDAVWLYLFVQSVPVVIGVQLASLVALRVHRTLWRYLSVSDAVLIIRALTVGAAAAALAILLLYRFEGYSRAVFIFAWVLGSALIIGSRSFLLWLRQWFAARPRSGERRVLIVGATESGAVALRLLSRLSDVPHRAIGFLDDDPGKRYRSVGGVPIVGMVKEVADAIARHNADLVVLALEQDRAGAALVRQACRERGIECREFLAPV